MNDSATQLVQLIREIVREELKDKDSTALFIVRQKNSNETYNISIYPDLDTVFYNIPNASKYDFDVGDMGVLYKLNNKPNNSFIINKFNYYNSLSPNSNINKFNYRVEQIVETKINQFSFNDGYYRSNCQGVNDGWSICKIIFTNLTNQKQTVVLHCANNLGNKEGEFDHDYGIVSYLNSTLSLDNQTDSSYLKSFKGLSRWIDLNIEIPVGESFITCKYKKDSSVDMGLDCFSFTILN